MKEGPALQAFSFPYKHKAANGIFSIGFAVNKSGPD